MVAIPNSKIRQQIGADLIGKDSYRGVTLTYSWFANQFGHFSLGYVMFLIVYWIFNRFFPNKAEPITLATIISICVWLAFEIYNVVKSIYFDKGKGGAAQKYVFNPDWSNIIFDTITDLMFFWLGSISASIYFLPFTFKQLATPVKIISALVFLFTLFRFSKYWVLTKMYLQTAQFPYQLRLSQWNNNVINEDDTFVIRAFVEKTSVGNHLLIFGADGSGKTSLAVGIGTEFAIKHRSCVYTTGMKLIGNFYEKKAKKGNDLWDWCDCSLLIIDDINPGDPATDSVDAADTIGEIISASQFSSFMNGASYKGKSLAKRNIDALKKKNVIWVLGTCAKKNSNYQAEWINLVQNDIGVENVHVVDLKTQKYPKA